MILLCNRSDNLFGSLSTPGPVEMPITNSSINHNDDVSRNRDSPTASSYVTNKTDITKRSRSEVKAAKNDQNIEEPPTKKLKGGKREVAGKDNSEAEVGDESEEEKLHSSNSNSKGLTTFTELDVISGRGGGTNLHSGNRYFRDLILSHRSAYDEASKTMKPEISRQIVFRIKERGGRFLRKDSDGLYYEIDEAEAKAKTSQALRHRTFELRNIKDPGRAKMNGRWKQNGSNSAKSTSPTTTSSSGGKNDPRISPMSSVHMLPSIVSQVQSGFVDPPMSSRNLLSETSAAAALAADRSYLHESIRRQRLLEATMTTPGSARRSHDDAAYMTALANLRHREAMLNLDRAIHEAEKRRYTSVSYPSNFSTSFGTGLPGSASGLSGISSIHHPPYGLGSLPGSLSLARSGSLGSSSHESALLHSRLGAAVPPLGGDIRDRISLQHSTLPSRGLPLSPTSLASRERLSEMDILLKSRAAPRGIDDSDRSNPKSPRR